MEPMPESGYTNDLTTALPIFLLNGRSVLCKSFAGSMSNTTLHSEDVAISGFPAGHITKPDLLVE